MRKLFLLITLFGTTALASGVTHYSNGLPANQVAAQSTSARTIEQTIKAHIDALMEVSGVVGVGQGLLENTPCIKVFVVEITPELQRQIPKMLDGHPVVVEEIGRIKALPKDRIP
jgi:hypothetical protein